MCAHKIIGTLGDCYYNIVIMLTTYGITNCGSDWRMDVIINCCLEFGLTPEGRQLDHPNFPPGTTDYIIVIMTINLKH